MDFGQETLLLRKLAHVVLDCECTDEIYKCSEDSQKTEWKQLEDRSWSLDLTGTWVAVEAVDVKG